MIRSWAPPCSRVTTLHFAHCELDLTTRRLRRGGRIEPVQPRVFDLLAYLVAQRGRVVPKEELVTAVWRARVLSPSVVSRALMLLRRHIGDDPEQPFIVRTVHGVGYEFVAGVRLVEHPAEAPAATPPLRLGLWREPWERADTALDEADHALRQQWRESARDLGCRLVPLPDGEIEGLDPAALAPLLQRHGVDRLVAYTLARETGVLWFDSRSAGPGSAVTWRSAREATPAELARRLLGAWRGEEPAWAPAVEAAPASDPFACRACARGLELNAWQEWDAALRLFEVALVVQPGLWAAELGRLESRIGRHEAAARPLAQALLARAQATGHAPAAAACHAALECLDGGQALPAPQPLMAPAAGAGDALGRQVLSALLAAHAGLFSPDAPAALLEAAEECARAGDSLRHAAVLTHLGGLRLLRDELPLARDELARAAAQLAARRAPLSRARTLSLLGLVLMRLGHVGEALGTVDQVLAALLPARELADAAFAPALLALTALEVADLPRLRRIDALLAGTDVPARRFTQAALAAAEGRVDDACAWLAQAPDPQPVDEPALGLLWMHEGLRLAVATAAPPPADAGTGDPLIALLRATRAPTLAAQAGREAAARALQAGEAAAALQLLLDGAAMAPIGRTLATLRLDAAWLLCEAGDLERARMLWQATAGYGVEHPLGRSVRARVAAGDGDFATAALWQARALAAWGGLPPSCQAALARHYEAAVTGRATVTAPLGRLASTSWWWPSAR